MIQRFTQRRPACGVGRKEKNTNVRVSLSPRTERNFRQEEKQGIHILIITVREEETGCCIKRFPWKISNSRRCIRYVLPRGRVSAYEYVLSYEI